MCEYCFEDNGRIHGKIIRTSELKNTAGYQPERNKNAYKELIRAEAFEMLDIFILKGRNDEKAGLMLDTISGGRYIDINYCPMCGRKLGDDIDVNVGSY